MEFCRNHSLTTQGGRCIRVYAPIHALIDNHLHVVDLVALSIRGALFLMADDAMLRDSQVSLVLPTVSRVDFEVSAEIEKTDRVPEGLVVRCRFLISDVPARQALNKLLALLLTNEAEAAASDTNDQLLRYAASK